MGLRFVPSGMAGAVARIVTKKVVRACAALIAAGSLVFTGCSAGASVPSGQSHQAPTESHGMQAATTTAAPHNTAIQLDSPDYAFFGHFLAAMGPSLRGFYASGPITLFHHIYGKLSLDAQHLMPGTNVVGQAYASAGTEQKPRLVAAFEVGEPAHDLDPPGTVVYLADIDPKTLKVTKKVEVKRFDTPGASGIAGVTVALAGSSANVVAVSVTNPIGGAKPIETIGFDLAAGKVVWNQPGKIAQAVFKGDGAIIRHDPVSPEKFCIHDSTINIVTGQEVFSAGGNYTENGWVACMMLKEMAFPAAGILAVNADASNNGSKVTNTAYDFSANRQVTLAPDAQQVDEHSDLFLAQAYDTEPVEIQNKQSGQVVHTIDKTTISNVSLRVSRLLDKKLWVQTTNEKLVLDATNGNTVERAWSSYPTYLVDGWVLYSDGRFVPPS